MNMKKYFEISMLKLLEEKNIDEITVNELIEEVGSCKGTFYKHYVDKYDLCHKCMEAHVYSQISFEVDNWEAFLLQCLDVFEKNAKVVVHAFDSSDVNSVRHFNENSVMKVLDKLMKERGLDISNPLNQFSIRFCGVAVTTIIYQWLKEGKKDSKETVLQMLRAVMPQSLYKDVYPVEDVK